MEAIAALSLAYNVLQLVNSTISVSKTLKDIHKEGGMSENDRLKALGEQLDSGAVQVEIELSTIPTSTTRNVAPDEIKAMVQDLRSINTELQKALSELQRKHTGLKGTLKTTWKTLARHDDVQALAKQLDGYRQLLSFRIETDLWQRITRQTTDSHIVQLIDSLRFPEINQRVDQIVVASEESFDWILTDDSLSTSGLETGQDNLDAHSTDDEGAVMAHESLRSTTWYKLDVGQQDARSKSQNWLQDDSQDIFWINGKVGSGKSTLMKKLWDHAQIGKLSLPQDDLRKACIIRYSFWLSGSPRQRSVKGFLSSMLYQLLTAYPTLAQAILQSAPKTAWRWNFGDWSAQELQKISDGVIESVSKYP